MQFPFKRKGDGLTAKQIEVAVQWWGERLKVPTFDMGADSRGSMMAEMMATVYHKSESEDTVTMFKQALAKELKRTKERVEWLCVGVDYWPGKILSDALEAAGVEVGMTQLPWKTQMWFQDGGVQVSLGYGGERQKLLEKDECVS